jgi:hypothetical protein
MLKQVQHDNYRYKKIPTYIGIFYILKFRIYFPSIPSFKSSSAGLFPNQIPNRAFLKSKPSIVPFLVPFLRTETPSPGT